MRIKWEFIILTVAKPFVHQNILKSQQSRQRKINCHIIYRSSVSKICRWRALREFCLCKLMRNHIRRYNILCKLQLSELQIFGVVFNHYCFNHPFTQIIQYDMTAVTHWGAHQCEMNSMKCQKFVRNICWFHVASSQLAVLFTLHYNQNHGLVDYDKWVFSFGTAWYCHTV